MRLLVCVCVIACQSVCCMICGYRHIFGQFFRPFASGREQRAAAAPAGATSGRVLASATNPNSAPRPSLLQLQRFVELLRPGAAGVEQALAFAQDTLAPLVQVVVVVVVAKEANACSSTPLPRLPQENPEFLPDMECHMCAACPPSFPLHNPSARSRRCF